MLGGQRLTDRIIFVSQRIFPPGTYLAVGRCRTLLCLFLHCDGCPFRGLFPPGKTLPKMVQTFWISPDPIINTLFGISERKQCAVLSKRLNYMPPICIGILEFIQNDDRVQGGDEFSDASTPVKNFTRVSSK